MSDTTSVPNDGPTNAPADEPRTSGWRLAIDFGTSYTAAASERNGRITTVLFDGSPRIPSVVAVDDLGRLVVGSVAEREMARAPERAERCPKRRIGDPVLLLGDAAVRPVDAIAAVLRYVFDEAVHQSGGARPRQVIITHPARWGSVRLGLMAEIARTAGLPEPWFVSEPVAAAAAESEAAALGDGQLAAVFDLGGGTFDTALVRRVGAGFEVVGPPGGNDRVGGETFDERLSVHLGELLARTNPDAWEQLRFSDERTWRRAAFDFRSAVRSAKEALSTHVDAAVYLGAPVDAEMRVTRDEFERLIHDDLQLALGELAATVAAAGFTPADLRSVFLVGGSGRIPLAARLVGEWLGRVPVTWGDPKSAVVIGALMVPTADLSTVAAAAPTAEIPVHPQPVAPTEPVPTPVAASVAGAAGWPAVAATPATRRRRGVLAAGAAVLLVGGAVAAMSSIGGGDSPDAASASTEASTVSTEGSTTTAPRTDATPISSESSSVPTTTATTTSSPNGSSTSVPTATTTAPAKTTTGTTVTTAARPTVTAAPATAAPATAAPVTAAPTVPPTVAPTTAAPAPTSKQVPPVIGVDTTTARSAIVNQAGFAGMTIAAGTCDASSIVTGYTPSGVQPLSSTITVWCN